MKIAFLTLNYLPATGGLVSYVKNMANYLTLEGHDVSIFCSKERGDKSPDFELLDNCKVHRIDVLNTSLFEKLYTPYSISNSFNKYFKESKVLQEFDLIIIRHVYLAHAVIDLSCLNKILFLTPLISPRLVKINARSEPIINKLYSWWLIPQLHALESKVMHSGIKIGVLSNSKQQEITDYYNIEKPTVYLPGINEERFFVNRDVSIKSKLPITLISVCRLVEEKNIGMVIRVLADLFEHNALDFKYVIVGDGPLSASLQQLTVELGIADKVMFTGFVDNPECYYRKADLFILPSSYEGFGHVYIEANACGIPVLGLSSSIPGVITACDEIIVDGVNGFLIKDNSIIAISNAINEYIVSGLEKSEWQEQCEKYAKNKYSWKRHFNEINESFK